jgi:hypothetical protein
MKQKTSPRYTPTRSTSAWRQTLVGSRIALNQVRTSPGPLRPIVIQSFRGRENSELGLTPTNAFDYGMK